MIVDLHYSMIGDGIDVLLYGVGHAYFSFLFDESNEYVTHEFESCSK